MHKETLESKHQIISYTLLLWNRITYFSEWIKETILWKKWLDDDQLITQFTYVPSECFPWSMIDSDVRKMDKQSLTKFKKMAPDIHIQEWDTVLKLYGNTKQHAIRESKKHGTPYNEDTPALEWMINDLRNIQDYYRKVPDHEKPKYVIAISYLARKLHMVWFKIVDLWEHVEKTEHATILTNHPLKQKILTYINELRWSIISLLEQVSVNRSSISYLKDEYEETKTLHRTQKRYKKKDIQLALLEMDTFLNTDLHETLKNRKLTMLKEQHTV